MRWMCVSKGMFLLQVEGRQRGQGIYTGIKEDRCTTIGNFGSPHQGRFGTSLENSTFILIAFLIFSWFLLPHPNRTRM